MSRKKPTPDRFLVTVTPTELKDYLSVLPDSVYQIELTSENFTIKLNMIAPDKMVEVAKPSGLSAADDTQVPDALREYFPQLQKLP